MQALRLHQAARARILELRCADIAPPGERARLPGREQASLDAGQVAGVLLSGDHQARGGNAVGMLHWLSVPMDGLGATPHPLMVDDRRLADRVAMLESVGSRRRRPHLPRAQDVFVAPSGR